jgi:homoserine dehydrogenase
MVEIRVAFLGFGNVGQALAKLLLRKREELADDFGIGCQVTGICTGRHGTSIVGDGIDLPEALEIVAGGGSLGEPMEGLDFVRACPADVLFESIPVNYHSGQPALNSLKAALEHGMHAISANKGPVVHGYQELTALAAQQGRKYYFESAVMDGAPIFSLFRAALPGAKLQSFHGILNSTTNLILGRMEEGESFDQAVAYAQSIGIAETDPSGDVDGWDAAVKVAALATVLMGTPLKPVEVSRQGIRGISTEQIQRARREGKRWKLVCTAERPGEKVIGRVAPELVSPASPLYGVQGTSSIVTFKTDVLPELSIVEGSPGTDTTAYGMLADLLNALRDA